LVDYTKRLAKAQDAVAPALMVGLNELGDQLVATMATNLAKRTGLSLEQVRGLMSVTRAHRSGKIMHYDVRVNHGVFESEAARRLEGKREDTDFGKRRPGALVIVVSKKDDLVCMDCEELEAAGPMPVEVAERHVPKHPNCRCVIMPYVPKGRRLPVTFATLSGTDTSKRTGNKAAVNVDMTLRQMAQTIINRSVSKIRIQLTK
jgi:hypothetical protein